MITKKQKQVFDFVKKYYTKYDYAPTLLEIKRKFKLASVSTAHYYLKKLQEAGQLKKEFNQPRAVSIVDKKQTMDVPILGVIAAGQPIEVIEVPNETITITKDEISKQGKHYALRVQGNSMINDGIFDGDIVVIRKQEVADNGQTVVAIIDDNQATLKKLYREKGKFRLQPANHTLFPIYRDEVEVRGVVVKIIRNLESQIEKDQS
ncbi:MAG: LexA repressor, partial [Parcubacteria group bacterium GW2011_GWA2_44_13]